MATRTRRTFFTFLRGINFELAAAIIMALIAATPLYGIFERVTSQSDLIALFYGKAIVIRLIGICGIVIALTYTIVKINEIGFEYLRRKIVKNFWNLLFIIMLFWAIITTATAENSVISVWSYAYRYEGLMSYFAYAGVFFCGSMIRKDSTRTRIIDFAIIVAVILALMTLLAEADPQNPNDWIMYRYNVVDENTRYQLVGDYSGTFINTNHYGYYLCIVLMLCAGRFYHARKTGLKVAFALAFALNLRVLLYNDSFGPFLAVSIGLIAYYIVISVRDGITHSWPYLIIVAIFFGMGGLLNDGNMLKTYVTIYKEALAVFKTMEGAESNGQSVTEALAEDTGAGSGRMGIWLAAIKVWQTNVKTMIVGVGPENIPMEMKKKGFLESYEATHNTYLQVLAEMGIIGFVVYFSSQVSFFVRNIMKSRKMDPSALLAYGAAATYLVSAAFGITITVCEVFLYFVLGLANGYHTEESLGELLPPIEKYKF